MAYGRFEWTVRLINCHTMIIYNNKVGELQTENFGLLLYAMSMMGIDYVYYINKVEEFSLIEVGKKLHI